MPELIEQTGQWKAQFLAAGQFAIELAFTEKNIRRLKIGTGVGCTAVKLVEQPTETLAKTAVQGAVGQSLEFAQCIQTEREQAFLLLFVAGQMGAGLPVELIDDRRLVELAVSVQQGGDIELTVTQQGGGPGRMPQPIAGRNAALAKAAAQPPEQGLEAVEQFQ